MLTALNLAEPATPGRRSGNRSTSPFTSIPPSPFSPSLAIRSVKRDVEPARPMFKGVAPPRTSPQHGNAPALANPDMSSSASRMSDSFITAADSPVDPADTTGTALSSPPDSKREMSFVPRYRLARPFPVKLEMKAEVQLEEGVDYAIQLLEAALQAAEPSRPVYIPPPKHLALLATYAIHPKYTSHPEEPENARLSSQAIKYLSNLLRTVGPVNAQLNVAFAFRDGAGHDSESQDESEPLQCALARSSSIWQRAPNFWAALGWGLQCSVLYPSRWKHWKAWLNLMLEVLERDWEERAEIDESNREALSPTHINAPEHDQPCFPTLDASIWSKYMRNQPMKELIRALMAFSDGDNLADRGLFNTIFSRELAHPKTEEQEEFKMQKLDLENDMFGDYVMKDNDSSENEALKEPHAARSRKRRRVDTIHNQIEATEVSGPLEERVAETVNLRLRLFELLSQAYCQSQDIRLVEDLYTEVSIRIRQLPLEIFQIFIQPHKTPLSDDVYTSLLRYIILLLTPKDVARDTDRGLSLSMCERCFLPFASNKVSVEDNAKLALVLEAMLHHIIARQPNLEWSPTLRAAVEQGIAARKDKSKSRARGGRPAKGTPSDAARTVLEKSETHLRMLVDIIEGV